MFIVSTFSTFPTFQHQNEDEPSEHYLDAGDILDVLDFNPGNHSRFQITFVVRVKVTFHFVGQNRSILFESNPIGN